MHIPRKRKKAITFSNVRIIVGSTLTICGCFGSCAFLFLMYFLLCATRVNKISLRDIKINVVFALLALFAITSAGVSFAGNILYIRGEIERDIEKERKDRQSDQKSLPNGSQHVRTKNASKRLIIGGLVVAFFGLAFLTMTCIFVSHEKWFGKFIPEKFFPYTGLTLLVFTSLLCPAALALIIAGAYEFVIFKQDEKRRITTELEDSVMQTSINSAALPPTYSSVEGTEGNSEGINIYTNNNLSATYEQRLLGAHRA